MVKFQVCVLIIAISLSGSLSKTISSNEVKNVMDSDTEKSLVAAAVNKDSERQVEISDKAELVSDLLRFESLQELSRALYDKITGDLIKQIDSETESVEEDSEYIFPELVNQYMKNDDNKRNAIFAHSKQRLAQKYGKRNAIFAHSKQRLAQKYGKRNAIFAHSRQKLAQKYNRINKTKF